MSNEVWTEDYDRLAALIARAPHDARLREHAPARRARGAPSRGAARRGRGDGAPRQPREGASARRRAAAEGRRARRRSSRPRRSSSASTSATSISSARSARRARSRRSCSASAARATRSAGMPKGRLFPLSRDDLVECAALLARSGAASSTRSSTAQRAARRARAADRRRSRRARVARTRICFARFAARGRYRDLDAGALRRGRARCSPTASRRSAAAAARIVHSRRASTASCAAGAARGSPRSRPAARSRDQPTTTSCCCRTNSSVGTLNEDFAIESMAGDIFQLGNTSCRIEQVERGQGPRRRRARRAADDPVLARRGAGRSDELSNPVAPLERHARRARSTTRTRAAAVALARARRSVLDRIGAPSRSSSTSRAAKAALGALPTHETRDLRAVLRRDRRHAARDPLAVRLRASTARGDSRCASASAVSSTSSCRPPAIDDCDRALARPAAQLPARRGRRATCTERHDRATC